MIDFTAMRQKAEQYEIQLQDKQLIQLDTYAKMLTDWNTRMNLTGITDAEGIMTRHFEDSLTLLHYLKIAQNASVIDVGTGAGFPGMVLKIVRPDIRLTLLDSLQKRIGFLQAVASALEFDVNAVHLRAEEGGKMPQYRECFDVAVARAVAQLRELSEYCLPYVRVGGQFASMKGPDCVEEIQLARPGIGTLGGKVRQVHELMLSDGSGRSIVVMDKIKETPANFPRPSAKISKKPL